LLNASPDEVEALDESSDTQSSEPSSETGISDWKVTFESEALGSSELVVSRDRPLPKPGRWGLTSGSFVETGGGGSCNHPSVRHRRSIPRQTHRWHDRSSGGPGRQPRSPKGRVPGAFLSLVSSITRDQVSLGAVHHLRTIIDKGPMIWTTEMGDPWVVVALGMLAMLQAQTRWLCHVVVRSQGGPVYINQEYNPKAPWNSLFRSQLLIWMSFIHLYVTYILNLLVLIRRASYKHIFTLPSSMEKEVKATRSGNAQIHGIIQVTMAPLAYIAIQVCLAVIFHCYTTDHLLALLCTVILLGLLQD